MAFKHAFYILSLLKCYVNRNVNCFTQRNICKHWLNVNKCHKKIWILIKDFFTNWNLTAYSLIVNCSILLQLVKKFLQGCNYKYQLQTKLGGKGVRYRYQLYLYELFTVHTLPYGFKIYNHLSINNCGCKDSPNKI